MNPDFEFVDRPTSRKGRSRGVFGRALLETLQNGRAVAIPVNGTDCGVLRQRLYSRGRHIAAVSRARVRTASNADETTVFVWLEAKS